MSYWTRYLKDCANAKVGGGDVNCTHPLHREVAS
eukprot:COSAG01_NODE_26859_length_700_cov_1.019934_1_plen_33_part_10